MRHSWETCRVGSMEGHYDTIAIIASIAGMGTALALLLVPGQREMRRDIANLRERMARLEGAVDLLTKFLIDRERKAT